MPTMPTTLRPPLPKISPTVDGELFRRHQLREHEGEPLKIVDEVADATDRVKIILETVRVDCETILSDPTATEIRNRSRAAALADRTLDQINGILAPAVRETAAALAETEAAMQPKPSPNASEIRGRLAALPPEDRRKILAAPDDATMHAITSAPLWLSGITPADRDLAVTNYRRTRHPATLDRRDRIAATAADLDRVCQIGMVYASTLINRDGLDAAAQRAAAAARAAGEAA
jgi:hypothetical protein